MEQLSREDIFYNKSDCQTFNGYVCLSKDAALEAMDIFAKQVAVGFSEFIKDNHYTRNLNSEDTRWYKYFSIQEDFPSGLVMMSGVSEYFTSEELYELYTQSINK